MNIFCVLLLLFLTGCGDRYSLDEKRGPDPKGIVTTHPLSLPPDYMLRAPEPAEPTVKDKNNAGSNAEVQETSDKKTEK